MNYASGTITGKAGDSLKAEKLGTFKVGQDATVLLGPPYVFDKRCAPPLLTATAPKPERRVKG